VHRQILRVAAGALALGLAAAGCGGRQDSPGPGESASNDSNEASCEASAGRISIATANLGGVFYVLGGALAELINSNTNLKATAAETGGSAQNIEQLAKGDYDIAFVNAADVLDAVNGRRSFVVKPDELKALTRLFPSYIQVVVRTDAGIDDVWDLRGKRISTGSPKSGSEAVAHHLLESAGIDPKKDIQAQRLDVTKGADGLKSGAIDAMIVAGGIPYPQIIDITATLRGKVKLLDVTSQLDELKKINPAYEEGVIPKDTYRQPADVPAVVQPTALIVRDDFPAGDACAITKLIFEKKAELEKAHASAAQITLSEARRVEPLMLHPGAVRALDMLGH
jgi:TRAP transporter TAXI family solute receptor